MKLRNKKTGEIVGLSIYGITVATRTTEQPVFHSIRELNETFEDVPEEPKTIWYITHDGCVCSADLNNSWTREKEIGNYFETKEEAEKAVEKLKAWKKLRDNKFKFKRLELSRLPLPGDGLKVYTEAYLDKLEGNEENLKILFREEE